MDVSIEKNSFSSFFDGRFILLLKAKFDCKQSLIDTIISIEKDFETKLSAFLKRTKDIFVVGCTVGLRYGDLMRLKKNNLQQTTEGNFMVLHTGKTGTELRIPIPKYVIEIDFDF